MLEIIFLRRYAIKEGAQTDCKEQRGGGSRLLHEIPLICRNTSENNFAVALPPPSPSVVSKGSAELSAREILRSEAFAQKGNELFLQMILRN